MPITKPKKVGVGGLLTGARQYVCIPVCVCVISSLEPFYHCVAAFKNKRYDVHQSLTRLFHEKSFSPGPLKRFFFVPRCPQENAYKFFWGGFYPLSERLIRPNFQFVRPPPFCAWTIFQRASRREPVDNFRNEIITQQASITCGKEREFVRIFFCLKGRKKEFFFYDKWPQSDWTECWNTNSFQPPSTSSSLKIFMMTAEPNGLKGRRKRHK
jgi:hypothetical protein